MTDVVSQSFGNGLSSSHTNIFCRRIIGKNNVDHVVTETFGSEDLLYRAARIHLSP
jgi:hypothetical protein